MVEYKWKAVKMANKESDPENENIPKDVQEHPIRVPGLFLLLPVATNALIFVTLRGTA